MKAFIRVAGLVPLSLARKIGRTLGQLAYFTLRSRRRVALQNLDIAWGDALSNKEKRRIARGVFENIGIVAMEFPHTPKAGAAPIVKLVGQEHFDQTRGALFVSAHAANWEWMAATIAAHGMPVAEVVNEYSDSQRGELIDSVRRASGVTIIPKLSATGQIMQLLASATKVGILVDQSARRNRVPTTFFGQPCWTTSGPAVLALRKDIPLHVFMMHREPAGDYVLKASPRITIERTKDFRRDVATLTQHLQDMIEEHVRQYPDQWLWIHKRWKARPDLRARWADLTSGAAAPSTPALATETSPPSA